MPLAALEDFEKWVAGLLIAALFLVVLLDIAVRNILNTSLVWPEEVSRVLFIWAIFIGGAAALRSEKLIAIDVVYRYLPPRGRRLLDVASFLAVGGCVAVLAWYGLVFFARFAGDVTPTTGMRKGYFYAAVPVGAALMAIRLVEWFWRRMKGRPVAPAPEAGGIGA